MLSGHITVLFVYTYKIIYENKSLKLRPTSYIFVSSTEIQLSLLY